MPITKAKAVPATEMMMLLRIAGNADSWLPRKNLPRYSVRTVWKFSRVGSWGTQ